MYPFNAPRLPEPIATGSLARKPLAHLLTYALERKLSGSFELVDGTRERMRIVIERSLVARVWTSEPIAYLGEVLYESGVVDRTQLSESLADVGRTKSLYGEALLARRIIDPDQLTEALRQQRSRKLHHAFGLPGGATFAFHPNIDLVGARSGDPEPTDPFPCIGRGISADPAWDHVRATIAAIGRRRLRVVGDTRRLELDTGERAVVEHLRQNPATPLELVICSGLDPRVVDLLAYFLVITKHAELTEPTGTTTHAAEASPTGRPVAVASSTGASESARSGSLTMGTSASEADTDRLPAPVSRRTGLVRVGASVARAETEPRSSGARTTTTEDELEADHLVSQAEMHLLLREHSRVAALARRALEVLPGMPEASALLAYVEAIALADGQERELRERLKAMDATIAKRSTCRRARYYRAEIKKRLHDHEGAVDDLRMAVRHDPDDADAARELVWYEREIREGRLEIGARKQGETAKTLGLLKLIRGKRAPD